jgi:hypothetical protein
MRVVKVEVVREDGTVLRLIGDAADNWAGLFVRDPPLGWQVTPPRAYVPVAWCSYCAEGGPHVLGVTPCPICARVAP